MQRVSRRARTLMVSLVVACALAGIAAPRLHVSVLVRRLGDATRTDHHETVRALLASDAGRRALEGVAFSHEVAVPPADDAPMTGREAALSVLFEAEWVEPSRERFLRYFLEARG